MLGTVLVLAMIADQHALAVIGDHQEQVGPGTGPQATVKGFEQAEQEQGQGNCLERGGDDPDWLVTWYVAE